MRRTEILIPLIIIIVAPLRVERSLNLFYSSSRSLSHILYVYILFLGDVFFMVLFLFFCTHQDWESLCPDLLLIYTKWGHLCPRYLGVIFFTQLGSSLPEIFQAPGHAIATFQCNYHNMVECNLAVACVWPPCCYVLRYVGCCFFKI